MDCVWFCLDCLLSSSLSSGLGTHFSFLSRIHLLSMTLFGGVMRWIPAKALDYVCVLSSTFSSLSLSLTSLLLPPTLLCVRFGFSVRILSFLDFRVHYQRLSFPCFQFIALAFIPQRSRSTFPIPIPCRFGSSSVYHFAFPPRFGVATSL